ncbi:hypothetical protein XENOCAPTIV_001160, partial [Xenoophorus captivus]
GQYNHSKGFWQLSMYVVEGKVVPSLFLAKAFWDEAGGSFLSSPVGLYSSCRSIPKPWPDFTDHGLCADIITIQTSPHRKLRSAYMLQCRDVTAQRKSHRDTLTPLCGR